MRTRQIAVSDEGDCRNPCNTRRNTRLWGGAAWCFLASLAFFLAVAGVGFVSAAEAQEEKDYPLHDAIKAGNNEEVGRLLAEQGRQALEQADDYGMLPLHYASSTGNVEISRLLLERYGIDPNTKPPSDYDWILRGRTPMHLAVSSSSLELVKLLVEKGGDPFVGDKNGTLPLHLAIQYGHMRVANFLMRRMGKAVHTADANKKMPLHWAAQHGRGVLAARLLELNGKVDARNNYGLTPLHFAALGGHMEVVELLLESRARINARDKSGASPLLLAARNGRKHVSDLLLAEKSINIDSQNEEGMSPLTVALVNGNSEVATRLLQHGANIRTQDSLGRTVLHHAVRGRNAVRGRKIKTIQAVLKKAGGDLNTVDSLGNTPLHYATQTGEKGVVELLLQAGANSAMRNRKNETAHDIARNLGLTEVLSVLR